MFLTVLPTALLAFSAVCEKTFPPDYYFGPGTDGSMSTVVDVSIQGPNVDGYCKASGMAPPCVYIHYTGPASKIAKPGPPDVGYCHKFIKWTYSAECNALVDGSIAAASQTVDGSRLFDPATGKLNQCADQTVGKADVTCWTAPAECAMPCDCTNAVQAMGKVIRR